MNILQETILSKSELFRKFIKENADKDVNQRTNIKKKVNYYVRIYTKMAIEEVHNGKKISKGEYYVIL